MQQEFQLVALMDAIEKWNEKLNLVSFKNRKELDIKHVRDSLALLNVFELVKGQRVLDLGAGGGFPGLPLAIMAPETEFVLVDSTTKKMLAVQEIANELGVNFFHRNSKHGGSKCTMKNVSVKCNGDRCQTHDHFVYDFMKNIETDVLFQVHATTPLMKADTIIKFVDYFEQNKFHSLFTVVAERVETIFRDSPINFSYKKKNPTQSLEEVFKMTSGIAAWDVDLYKKRYQEYSHKNNAPSFGDNIGWFKIPFIEGIDVDNLDDMEIVRSILYCRNQEINSKKIHYYHDF